MPPYFGGGYNIAGNAVCDDGLVIDLSRMKKASADPGKRRVVIESGATLAEPLRKFGTPLGEHVDVQTYFAWQQAFDPLLAHGARNYWKSHNFLTGDESDRLRAAYGPNYDRLARVKRTYDPTNLFCRNQDIKPA